MCLTVSAYIVSLGRRKVVLLTAVFSILSSFLIAASPTVGIYIILKGIMTAMDAGEYLALFVFGMIFITHLYVLLLRSLPCILCLHI